MDCEAGPYICAARELVVGVQPHLPWIGFLFGIAMAVWRWWDGREEVLYRRANRRLNERVNQLRDACGHAVGQVLWPSPGRLPVKPLFSAPALREVVWDYGWRPLFRFTDPLEHASDRLEDAHKDLAEKYHWLRQNKSFLVEQRFSAFLLEGAIASAQAGEKTGHDAIAKHVDALRFFEKALKVESKSADPLALELRGIQLYKLGRVQEALEAFTSLEASIANVLGGAANPTEAQRSAPHVQRIRVCRFRAEIHHKNGNNTLANNAMAGLAEHIANLDLTGQGMLERARFHELHACVRTHVARAIGALDPVAGRAQLSISLARSDYEAVRRHFRAKGSPPQLLWGKLLRRYERDGTLRLMKEATEGLARVTAIEAQKGCMACS